jgi:hypothetical protein
MTTIIFSVFRLITGAVIYIFLIGSIGLLTFVGY